MSWKPSPVIHASAALHAGTAFAVAAGLPWQWGLGAIATNHALLTVAGLWPRSTLLGHNMRSLPTNARLTHEISITIDDGPNPLVTPAVLDILDTASARASFFCVGRAIEANPILAREIVRRGHGIENHSYSHSHTFSLLGMYGLRNEISKAQETISQITGFRPGYFRAPAGLRNPLLDPVLQSLNLKLASWTRRGFDTVSKNPQKVLQRLERNMSAGDILLLHDGNCATTEAGKPIVLEVLPQLLASLKRMGLHSVPLHHAI